LIEAQEKRIFTTGLIYIENSPTNILDEFDLVDEPLNRLSPDRLRPDRAALERLNLSYQ